MSSRFVATLAAFALSSAAQARVIYVDADAWGANTGTSWSDALTSLPIALVIAGAGDEIWVAQGRYLPLADRSQSFEIPPGVRVLGGFGGTETSADQRDPAAHATVLDGDLNGDDGPGFVNRSDNCWHVVKATDPTPGTVLDGFIVRGGHAVNAGDEDSGGGLLVVRGSIEVARCVFTENSARSSGAAAKFIGCQEARVYDCAFNANATGIETLVAQGGAVSFLGSVLDVQRTAFVANTASAQMGAPGGAVVADGTAHFRDCDFIGNSARAELPTGGACVLSGPTTFTRCTFLRNAATNAAGDRGLGGAVYVGPGGQRAVTLVGCELIGNQAAIGAAILASADLSLADSLVAGNTGSAAVHCAWVSTIANCTIAGNRRPDQGPAGVFFDGTLTVANSILHSNTSADAGQAAQLGGGSPAAATVDHSCVQGWDGSIPGSGSFDADPRFMDPDGLDDISGTADDDHRLRGGSPCIDAADSAAVPLDTFDLDDDGDTTEPLPLDLDLNPRRLDDAGTPDTGVGDAPYSDLGAYEFQGTSCRADVDGSGDLTLADFVGFRNMYVAGDLKADFDRSGTLTLADFLAFRGEYVAGCP